MPNLQTIDYSGGRPAATVNGTVSTVDALMGASAKTMTDLDADLALLHADALPIGVGAASVAGRVVPAFTTGNAQVTFTCGSGAIVPGNVVGGTIAGQAAFALPNLVATGTLTGTAGFMITSICLAINGSALISGESYALEIFNVTPPSALSDRGAWDLPSGDRSAHLGTITIGTPIDKGATLKIDVDGINKHVRLSGTGLFGYLVSTGTFTNTARTYVLDFNGFPL